jgi:hypothetical protein
LIAPFSEKLTHSFTRLFKFL